MGFRKAVNDKCKDCIYDPYAGTGTWRQQTEACDDQSCALWPYRPKSRGVKDLIDLPTPATSEDDDSADNEDTDEEDTNASEV